MNVALYVTCARSAWRAAPPPRMPRAIPRAPRRRPAGHRLFTGQGESVQDYRITEWQGTHATHNNKQHTPYTTDKVKVMRHGLVLALAWRHKQASAWQATTRQPRVETEHKFARRSLCLSPKLHLCSFEHDKYNGQWRIGIGEFSIQWNGMEHGPSFPTPARYFLFLPMRAVRTTAQQSAATVQHATGWRHALRTPTCSDGQGGGRTWCAAPRG